MLKRIQITEPNLKGEIFRFLSVIDLFTLFEVKKQKTLFSRNSNSIATALKFLNCFCNSQAPLVFKNFFPCETLAKITPYVLT